MAYEAVIFDFYGTLTEAIQRGPAHDGVARALGCDPPALHTLLDQTFAARARGEFGDGPAALAHLAALLGRTPTEDQLERTIRLRTAAVRASIRLRADAVSTLRSVRLLRRRTALVSDCTDELPAILTELPVGPLLDAAVFSVHVGANKPDPRLYLTACERLGVEPADCLYVGDGGGRELTGARAVGMTAVRLCRPDLAHHLVYDLDADWSGPSISTLSQVLALV